MASQLSSTAAALQRMKRWNDKPEIALSTQDSYSYSNSKPSGVSYSDLNPDPGSTLQTDNSYSNRARKFNRSQVLGIVKNDPVFRMAVDNWGTFAPTLIKACHLLGVKTTRDAILRVRAIADWRFSNNEWEDRREPLGQRRGRYLVRCLIQEAESRDLEWATRPVIERKET